MRVRVGRLPRPSPPRSPLLPDIMSDNEMEVDKAAAAAAAAAAAEAGPSTSNKAKGPKGGKRFEIKKWSAVAMWSWAVSFAYYLLLRRHSPSHELVICASRNSTRTSRRKPRTKLSLNTPSPPHTHNTQHATHNPTHAHAQICTDTCAICRNNLYEPSIEYQANPTGDPDHPGLSIAWGCCGHVFHLDCIQRWLKTRSACPLCNKEWEVRAALRREGFLMLIAQVPCLPDPKPGPHHPTLQPLPAPPPPSLLHTHKTTTQTQFAKIEKILAGSAMAVD